MEVRQQEGRYVSAAGDGCDRGGVIRSVLNRTLEITHDGMLGGLHGLQCGTIAGRSGIVCALADSTA